MSYILSEGLETMKKQAMQISMGTALMLISPFITGEDEGLTGSPDIISTSRMYATKTRQVYAIQASNMAAHSFLPGTCLYLIVPSP